MPLPEVNFWIAGVWAHNRIRRIPVGEPITYEKLTARHGLYYNSYELEEDFFDNEIFEFMATASHMQITRAELQHFFNSSGSGNSSEFYIGYCEWVDNENIRLLYVDVIEQLYSAETQFVWTRYAADGVDDADVPAMDNDWSLKNSFLVNDFFGPFKFKETRTSMSETTFELTTILTDNPNALVFMKAVQSLETYTYGWDAGGRSVTFKTSVWSPLEEDFEEGYSRTEELGWEDFTAMDNAAWKYCLEKTNEDLGYFSRLGFKATNWFGLGFPFESHLIWHYELLESMMNQVQNRYLEWSEYQRRIESEIIGIPEFLENEWVFPEQNPWIELKAKFSEIHFDARLNDTAPRAHISDNPSIRHHDFQRERESTRVGWESSIGIKRGFTGMSADVITTMQLECEWLSDITDQEKERKYREARAKLTPSDEGFFETWHKTFCPIAHEPLFEEVDVSKHEYRFAEVDGVRKDVVVLDCGHLFHKSSLQGWKANSASWTCPICRQELKRQRALFKMLFI